MDCKSHWGVVLDGEDSDKINLVKLMEELIEGNKLKLKITSAHVSTYYTTEEVKENRKESEAHRAHREGSNLFPVKEGG